MKPESRVGNNIISKIEYSVAPSDIDIAQNNLRMMEVESEILSHAVRRLYEAEAHGKINKNELEELVGRYKERLNQIKSAIQREKSMVALYDLEHVQGELIELFNKHFNDLNIKIDELKSRLGINPASEPTPKEKKKTQQKKQKKSQIEDTDEEVSSNEKSEADKKIEKIQTEIDKTLEKLMQIEIEV